MKIYKQITPEIITQDLRYLELLSHSFPTVAAASTEIINLEAILNLPKGTEHYLADLHGEYEAFQHVLRNASGAIKRKVNEIFGNTLREAEKKELCTLIYYPAEKLQLIKETEKDLVDWYVITLNQLVRVCQNVSSKYTRSKVRKALPEEFSYIIQELLHESSMDPNKQAYINVIISTIIDTNRADDFIIALCNLIQRLTIDMLHILGDIFDRTWKRYQGGMADDIRIYDFDTHQSQKITDEIRQDIIPMWSADGNKIYFISDRDDIMNLYVYNLSDKTTRQLTFNKDYDIKFPALGGDQIVYEQGGILYKFDTRTEKASPIPVEIDNDQNWARPEWKDVSGQISRMDVAPNGERVVVAARGDIFTLPAKSGITYNLTNSSNANDRNPQWSPDGKWIAYISDKNGEFNIWLRDAFTGEEKMLTKDLKTYIFDLKWAPDSRSILWSEKKNTLNLTQVSDGKTEVIASSGVGPINSFNWSQDSRYITYIQPEKEMDNIIIYDRNSKEKHQMTDGWYNVSSPNFSKDGKYLVFVSARTFNPTYSSTEWNHVYNNMNKIYILPLTQDATIPFAPENDNPKAPQQTPPTRETKKSEATKEHPKNEYDYTNIANRIIELPVSAGNYHDLHMIGNQVYFNRYGNTSIYNLKDRKETDLNSRIIFGPGYEKAIAQSGRAFQVIDIPNAPVSVNHPISTSDLKKYIDYHQDAEDVVADVCLLGCNLFR